MRRRIYMDRESGPVDATDSWPLWNMEDYVEDPEPLAALRDEALWEEYEKAQAVLRDVETRLMRACKDEPWDAIEIALGREAFALMRSVDDYDADRIVAIEDELVKNARLA